MSELRKILQNNVGQQHFTHFALMSAVTGDRELARAEFSQMLANGEIVEVEARPLGMVYKASETFTTQRLEKVTLNGSHIEQIRSADSCLIVRVTSAI